MTLDELREITSRKQQTDREWRDAIALLVRDHSTRKVADAAGIGHVTVHRYARRIEDGAR